MCPAASSRTFSLSAAIAASSLDDFEATDWASGSLCAACAASRLAWALCLSRGMVAWAVEIALAASPIHLAAPSL
jgi:hypothetical protein